MLRAILRNAGSDPRRFFSAVKGWRRYVRERSEFRNSSGSGAFPWAKELPILTEWNDSAGSLGTYFFQDQLVARWVYQATPIRHVDVGSRIDGFIGSLSAFRKVEVIDIRPLPVPVENVTFHQLNLMEPLPPQWQGATDSLSCLHTIEHFGLGRYGDPIDPKGHLMGVSQLKAMVKPGGLIYLSTPIGPQRIEFNAHRVFAVRTVLDWFVGDWKIEKLAMIDDDNHVREFDEWTDEMVASNFGCKLGVGIVAARKL